MDIKRRVFLRLLVGGAATATYINAHGLSLLNLEQVDNPFAYPPEYRGWEDLYREEWTWDSVARSTHGVNCTGSCSFKVYVKDGVIMREEQAADYPEINPARYPSLNPRGCNKGTCFAAEYVNGDRRIKYPLMRAGARGSGNWQQVSWDQALGHIADKMLDTIENHGPDALTFFSPIPAMSPVSYSSGARLAHLVGGVMCSFYDWYCDLPPGSPITLGEQTDVAESTDWMNARYMILWGSNPLHTRIPDAHFLTEAKYRGCKVLAIHPEYSASAVRSDRWLSVTPGSDAALALSVCQVLIRSGLYDTDYLREQTDMALLVDTETGRYLRPADAEVGSEQDNEFYFYCETHDTLEPAPGGEEGSGLALGSHRPSLTGSYEVPRADGSTVIVEPLFQRLKRHLDTNFTPAQAGPITGIGADVIEEIAVEIGDAGISSGGKVMIMHGAGTNHWYHNDLNNRAMLLMLSLLGAIGKNGGGFNHYVGQEKFWPAQGLKALSSPEGAARQRFQNTTLWTYVHSKANDLMGPDEQAAAGLSQPVRGYIFDSVDRGWMPLFPEGCLGTDKETFVGTGATTKDPKMMFVWRGNWFNQAKGNNTVESDLYPKLDLIVNVNFQMDSSALYSDIVLPAASHYEKYDLNTTDMHSFIHPFTPAIPPMFDSKSDWQIFKALAAKIEERAIHRSFAPFYDEVWGGNRDLTTLLSQFTDNGALADDDKVCQFVLDNAIETNPGLVPGQGMTMADLIAQPQRLHHATTWTSDIEDGRPYTPFLKMTEGKHRYETLTGRQQYLVEHEWFAELGEDLPTYKPAVAADDYPLRYNTPHERWSIHSTWRNAKQLLRLQRGGPIVLMHPSDMSTRGLNDDDWVRVHNDQGEVIVRVKTWESEKAGRVTMYHGWERYLGVKKQKANFNSVSALRIKPTQLAGNYGQLHFKFNYWGPTGVQRDVRVEVERYTA
ncbi:MAG: molybdopterin-dependent oxidoreductase [Gammaproteobacteria bacterium]|nr:molybdopterin-dependent oxidoreductase [Gammaproteobacteria bacterium]